LNEGKVVRLRRTKSAVPLRGLPLSAQTAAAAINLTGEAAHGKRVFVMNCDHFHADDARLEGGPDLYDLHKTNARIHDIITGGIKGEMFSFAKKLNGEYIKAITAFPRSLRS
jgi:mono/diheme cytochrome c family protein